MTNFTIAPVLHRALHLLWRGLLLAWAGFWVWFVVTVSIGEPPPPPLWIPFAWIGSLAGLVFLAWKRPTFGGVALIVAGIGAAVIFPTSGARSLLAAPAIGLGLGALALRRLPGGSVRRAAVAMPQVGSGASNQPVERVGPHP